MRDLETIATALTLAETGHLIFATLHTTDAAQTVDRMIDVFPPYQQEQVRTQLSVSLRAVICQQLLPRADGKGRIAARDVMIIVSAVGCQVGLGIMKAYHKQEEEARRRLQRKKMLRF
jgi:twitching motility protein PilT